MTSLKVNSSLIYLARHGQTFGNIERVIKDPMTEFLTKKGESQAEILGNHLSDVKFTRICCSDFPRAVDTTKIVIEKLKKPPLNGFIQDPRIREFQDPKYIGQSYNTISDAIGVGMEKDDPFYDYAEFHLEDSEPVAEVIARQESFFEDFFSQLDESKTEETVLIVSHGCLIQLIMKHMLLAKKYELQNWVPELTSQCLENCSYHVLRVSKLNAEDQTEGDNSKSRVLEFVKIHQNEHLNSRK